MTLTGLYVPLITPFDATGAVALDALAALRELAGLPGAVGTRHAPGGIGAETVALLADPPPGFAVLGDDDVVISPLLAMALGGRLAPLSADAACAATRHLDGLSSSAEGAHPLANDRRDCMSP
jgi:hypothetical protein